MLRSVRLSVCLSVLCPYSSTTVHFKAMVTTQNTNRKPPCWKLNPLVSVAVGSRRNDNEAVTGDV